MPSYIVPQVIHRDVYPEISQPVSQIQEQITDAIGTTRQRRPITPEELKQLSEYLAGIVVTGVAPDRWDSVLETIEARDKVLSALVNTELQHVISTRVGPYIRRRARHRVDMNQRMTLTDEAVRSLFREALEDFDSWAEFCSAETDVGNDIIDGIVMLMGQMCAGTLNDCRRDVQRHDESFLNRDDRFQLGVRLEQAFTALRAARHREAEEERRRQEHAEAERRRVEAEQRRQYAEARQRRESEEAEAAARASQAEQNVEDLLNRISGGMLGGATSGMRFDSPESTTTAVPPESPRRRRRRIIPKDS